MSIVACELELTEKEMQSLYIPLPNGIVQKLNLQWGRSFPYYRSDGIK